MKTFEKIEELKLENINILEAGIENRSELEVSISTQRIFQVSIHLKKGFNIEAEKALIKLQVNIEILNEDRSPRNVSAKFSIDFRYHVTHLKDYLDVLGEGGQVDAALSGALLGTAYSTARGILYTRLQGTALGNFMLPILSINQLIEISEFAPPNKENIIQQSS